MQKNLLIAVAALMCVVVLSGCGSDTPGDPKATAKKFDNMNKSGKGDEATR